MKAEGVLSKDSVKEVLKKNSFHPMHITLKNTGKRFNQEWIFRKIDFAFLQGKSYAITGANGSGKSTLLQVIAGALMHSEGAILYTDERSSIISENKSFKNISFAAPYLDLIEEMTATELLEFHATFKPLSTNIEDVLESVGLKQAAHKQIRYFSSGMKQRLKLAQAFFSKTTAILLDEPTTNLDKDGIELYLKLINSEAQNKLIIVCSNDSQEYSFCEEIISIENFKV